MLQACPRRVFVLALALIAWLPRTSAAQPLAEPQVWSGSHGARPISAGLARLRVAVNRPETQIIVDDTSYGEGPIEVELSPGTHRVLVSCSGFKTWVGTVDLDGGTVTPLRVTLRPTMSRSAGVTLLVLSTVVGAGGASMGLVSEADRAALAMDRLAGTLNNRDPRIDRGATFAGLADVSFLLTAALATTGIFLIANDPTPPSIGRVGRLRRLRVE